MLDASLSLGRVDVRQMSSAECAGSSHGCTGAGEELAAIEHHTAAWIDGTSRTDAEGFSQAGARLRAMHASRRATSIAVGAAALAVVAAAVLILFGPLGGSGGSAADPPCSSYPAPGTLAPAGTKVPPGLTARYAVFGEPQRAVDRLAPGQVASLGASGLIMSGTRLLGDVAHGGRLYLVPAEHLLASSLAPPRCLSQVQRVIEQASLPVLRTEYRQTALCIIVLYAKTGTHDCVPANGTPYALLSEIGTPGFGLVPNGVTAVTVTYQVAPPRTVPVHRNFFAIGTASRTAPPCGVQWLDPTGNVRKTPVGCSFLTVERQAFAQYRAYVARKLSTLRAQVAQLSAAVGSGNLAHARSAWLTAHLTWLEIGQDDGAYGCFGPLGGQIDGLAAGHPRGTADPGFTGFHRIEFDLWAKRDLRAASADTTDAPAPGRTADEGPAVELPPGDRHRHRQLAATAARGPRGRAPRLADRR